MAETQEMTTVQASKETSAMLGEIGKKLGRSKTKQLEFMVKVLHAGLGLGEQGLETNIFVADRQLPLDGKAE